jgi:hypothetical protein
MQELDEPSGTGQLASRRAASRLSHDWGSSSHSGPAAGSGFKDLGAKTSPILISQPLTNLAGHSLSVYLPQLCGSPVMILDLTGRS